MARVKFSGLISEISGSIGGATFSTSRHGPVIKTKHKPSFKSKGFQSSTRRAYSQAVNAWKLLTPSERANYNSFAKVFPSYPASGVKSPLSGYELFLKYNTIYGTIFPGILTSFNFDPPQTPSVSVSMQRTATELLVTNTCIPSTLNFTLFHKMSPPSKHIRKSLLNRVRLLVARPTRDNTSNRLHNFLNTFGYAPESGDFVYIKQQILANNYPIITPIQILLIQVT